MKRWSEDWRCPKCNTLKPDLSFDEQVIIRAAGYDPSILDNANLLLITCRRCGFREYVHPLDYEGDS